MDVWVRGEQMVEAVAQLKEPEDGQRPVRSVLPTKDAPPHFEDPTRVLRDIDVPFVVEGDAFLVLARKCFRIPDYAWEADFKEGVACVADD